MAPSKTRSTPGLDVEVHHLPRVGWALAHGDLPVIREVRVTNRTGAALPDLVVTASIDGFTRKAAVHRTRGLPPGATLVIDDLRLELDDGALAAVTQPEEGSLWIEVGGDDALHARAHPVEILAADQWAGPAVLPELLAAFCRPDHPLAASIAEPLGYRAVDPLRIADRLRVLHDHLASLGLASAPWTDRVRAPDRITDDGTATALEAALWIAAVLEGSGLHPLIAVCGQRALVGVWRVDHALPFPVADELQPIRTRIRAEELLFVEALPGLAYGDAKDAALEALDAGGIVVDVTTARRTGVRPLPVGADEVAPGSAPAPEQRSQRLERWKARLLDLSMRNRLLNARDPRTTLPLVVRDVGRFEDLLAAGAAYTFAPRVRTAVEEAAVDAVAACPWCASPASGHRCASCGGPLQVVEDHGDVLAGISAESRGAKVVVVDLPEAELARRLVTLYRSARHQLEESGANTLYVAIGLLRYYESAASTTPRAAPVLLYPVRIERTSVRTGYTLVRTDEDPLVNAPLLQYLHQVHGFDCLALAELPRDDDGVDVPLVLRRFRRLVEPMPRWAVSDAAWVTQLSFTRYLMWLDLDARSRELLRNPAVRQLLTDDDAPWPSLASLPSAETVDARPVADLPCPLDADASQRAAVTAAAEGHSFVLQGPPGTGKSQTIANLIAHALAHGRTVLFVSEKMAALDVVHGRLAAVGLAPFCLELHSNHTQRTDVVRQLQEAIDAAGRRDPGDWDAHASTLQRARDALSATVRALHEVGPLGLSAWDAADALAAYHGRADLPVVRVDLGPPDALDPEAYRSLLADADALRDLAQEAAPATNPWRPVRWTHWRSERLPQVRAALSELDRRAAAVEAAGDRAALAPRGGRDVLEALGELAALLTRCPAPTRALVTGDAWPQHRRNLAAWVSRGTRRRDAWDRLRDRWSPALLTAELRPWHERFAAWADRFAWIAWVALFGARRSLGAFARGPLGPHAAVRDDLAAALDLRADDAWLADQREAATALLGPYWAGADTDFAQVEGLAAWSDRFRSLVARIPPLLGARLVDALTAAPERFVGRPDLTAFAEAVSAFSAARDGVAALLELDPGDGWGEDAGDHLGAVRARLAAWRDEEGALRGWVAWRAATERLRAAGVGAALDVDPEDLPDVVRRAVLTWWLDAWTGATEPSPGSGALRAFHGPDHDRLVARFRALEADSRTIARREVRARLAARIPALGGANLGEMGVLARELRKKRGHLSTRKLFEAIPHVLQRIKPCVLMSPLSVAQYLDPALDPFDLVVFDEASQIPPWQAIGAMARGRQVIVVGDSKQLPPTMFFARGEDGVDEEARRDLESVLDECVAMGMPSMTLDWHYRSRHEGLIAFSNRHYYGGRLATFPCARARAEDLGVRLRYCADGAYDKGRTRTNRPEAEALVAEVVAALSDPSHARTIGIVTFSLAQQTLIEDLLDRARAREPALERWFVGDQALFVKNLENVQGDERDVIYLSVCYGPDTDGGLSLNFGPLNRVGGERRLNVALTRARTQLVVFASLRSDRIDLSRTSALGVRHLRAFLQYAEQGEGADPVTAPPTSALAAELAGRLDEVGYTVDTEVGSSALRIEVAVRDPDAPGRYLLGVETDGRRYAEIPSTGDRDRLRAEVLGELGWSLHRAWALDWARDPGRAWGRLVDALEEARVRAPRPTAPRAPHDAHHDGQGQDGGDELVAPLPVADHPRYTAADGLPGPATAGESFYHGRAERRVVEALQQVLAVEAPLHLTELVRRVGAAWGVTRVTAKPKAHVTGLLAKLDPAPRVQDEFVWRADQDPAAWTTVRVPGLVRAAEAIPPEEFAAAVGALLRGSVSSTRADLARGAAQLLGIARAGPRVRAVVDAAIDRLAAQGHCRIAGDVVTLT